MKFLSAFALLLLAHFGFGQSKTVCFSIDDLPVVSYGNSSPAFHLQTTAKILSALQQEQVRAIGFVNEGKMYDSDGELLSDQKQCLEQWLAAGMDLGNHTLKHRDFNTTDFDLFTSEILKGEIQTKELLGKYGMQMQYFRHPFLHVGATKERADSLADFLTAHKYIAAPVTIDNEDYVFAHAYAKTLRKNDTTLAQKIGAEYISYMEQKLLYYERQSQALFDRQIPQVLLIHASQLNADFLPQLIDLYKQHGYDFVSMATALVDEAYTTPVTKFGKYGISWIDRWALSQGKKGDFFTGDPETPAYISEISRQP